jgi:D-aminopeptidase
MARALGRLAEVPLYKPDLPLHGEVDFRLPIMADYACVLPGTERVGPRTVGFRADDGDAFYRICLALTRLATVPAT